MQRVESPPAFGTFFFGGVPFPFDPSFGQRPLFEAKPGVYIVDNSEEKQAAGLNAQNGGGMMLNSLPGPGSGVGCTSCTFTNICCGPMNFTVTYQLSTTNTPPYGTNDLWLELQIATNNIGNLIIQTPNPNLFYDVYGTTNLSPYVPPLNQTNWIWLQRVSGGPTNFLWTNITPCQAWFQAADLNDDDGDGLTTAYETLVSKTNPNETDSDGDGLSDRYELTTTHTDPNNPDTGNTGIPDGYRDTDGDGWTNIDEERNGTDPSAFNTPPPPPSVVVHLFPGNTNVLITWQAANGPITGYVIRKNGNVVATVASNVFEVTAPVTPSYFYGPG